MSVSRHHSWLTRWKRYFVRVFPALGGRPQVFSDSDISGARRILLVKRDNIGDAVLATTFLNLAYERWGDRDVTILCGGAAKSLLTRFYPRWKLIVIAQPGEKEFRRPRWRSGGLRAELSALGEFDLMVNLRGYRYQEELIFDSWIRARAKVALANQAPARTVERIEIGDDRVYGRVLPGRGGTSPEGARLVCKDIHNHRTLAEYFFEEARVISAFPQLGFTPEALDELRSRARQHGASDGRVLALCPYPSQEVRMYPEPQLIEAAVTLARCHALEVEILGGPDDVSRAEALRGRLAEHGVTVRSLAGVLKLEETAAVLAAARLVLAVDTGLPHMAIALGAPTVVLIGGGHFGWFGPWGASNRARWLTHRVPCFHCNWQCSQPAAYCLTEIPVRDVIAAGEALLSAPNS